MAEDMITRAAKAGDYEDAAQKGEPSIWSESHFPPGEEGMAELYDERRAVYQAALLAALDPEDEALVERVAKRICIAQASADDIAALDWSINRDRFRVFAAAAINGLKSIAQGVSVSQEQVREKD